MRGCRWAEIEINFCRCRKKNGGNEGQNEKTAYLLKGVEKNCERTNRETSRVNLGKISKHPSNARVEQYTKESFTRASKSPANQ